MGASVSPNNYLAWLEPKQGMWRRQGHLYWGLFTLWCVRGTLPVVANGWTVTGHRSWRTTDDLLDLWTCYRFIAEGTSLGGSVLSVKMILVSRLCRSLNHFPLHLLWPFIRQPMDSPCWPMNRREISPRLALFWTCLLSYLTTWSYTFVL
jgi:hypothetical protein